MSEPYTIGKLTRRQTNGGTYWSYCLKYWQEGQRVRLSLGTTDPVAAQITARQLWAGLSHTEYSTLGELVPAYLDSLGGTKDEKRKREAWVAASPYWQGLTVAVIDPETSSAYLCWRNRSTNTVRIELNCIRCAIAWGVVNKYIETAPKIVVPAPPLSSVGHITKEQFRQFLTGCASPHIALFAMLAVSTGGRKSAILQTKWEQVDLDRGILDLNPRGRVQNRKHRATVGLNEQIIAKLRAAKEVAQSDYIIEQNGQPLQDIKKGVAAASARSDVAVHPHMFRHSAAVWMAEAKVPMGEIAAFLGHKDINVTVQVYARYNPDYLRGAAKSLEW
jgi:integrase